MRGSLVAAFLNADPAKVIFSDDTIEDPTVTFPPVSGTYILSLTADDTTRQVTDEVNIVVVVPTCADVLADGLGYAIDLSGPEGVPDCHVDMFDFMVLIQDWLKCNDPADPICVWPYQN